MNDQSYLSPNSTPFAGPGPSSSNPLKLMIVLVVVLGLGAVIFAILTIKYYATASTATNTLKAQVATAIKAGASAQQKLDTKASLMAGESPFRSFVAPAAYGSFAINFPKNWSGSVDEEQSGTQVTLILNPNFVSRTNGTNDPAAAVVTLQEQTSSNYDSQYSGPIQEGLMKQTTTSVSGQPAAVFTGQFPSQGPTVREVVVPVRDKVLVFDNNSSQYSAEFDEILAQAKINP